MCFNSCEPAPAATNGWACPFLQSSQSIREKPSTLRTCNGWRTTPRNWMTNIWPFQRLAVLRRAVFCTSRAPGNSMVTGSIATCATNDRHALGLVCVITTTTTVHAMCEEQRRTNAAGRSGSIHATHLALPPHAANTLSAANTFADWTNCIYITTAAATSLNQRYASTDSAAQQQGQHTTCAAVRDHKQQPAC